MVSKERKLDCPIINKTCPSTSCSTTMRRNSAYQYRESVGRKFEEEYFRKLEELEYQERIKRQEMARPGFTVIRGSDGRLTSVPDDVVQSQPPPSSSNDDDTKENTTPTEQMKIESTATASPAQPPTAVGYANSMSQIKKMRSS